MISCSINTTIKEFIVMNSQYHSETDFQLMGLTVDVIR